MMCCIHGDTSGGGRQDDDRAMIGTVTAAV